MVLYFNIYVLKQKAGR